MYNSGKIMDINEGFKHACRFIFGQEIGEMKDYDEYMREGLIGKFAKSSFSNEKIFMTSDQYSANARFFDYGKENERVRQLLSQPINGNKIKDIDSLLEAVEEKAIYAGGKVLGKSENIVESDNIINCNHVYRSSASTDGKYLAYCYDMRKSDYGFACSSAGECSWILRCYYVYTMQRCFECTISWAMHDCYFCHNVRDASDCMFSFHLQAKHNVIGNIVLDKQKYAELKKKLIDEIVEKLKKNKRLDFGIVNLMKKGGLDA